MSGFVYFISDPASNAIKIGYSTNPEGRLAALRTANSNPLRLLLTLEGSPADERAIHERLAVFRFHGEWFHACPPITDFMTKIVTATKRGQAIGDFLKPKEKKPKPWVMPTGAAEFRAWVEQSLSPWPGPLQIKACHAIEGLEGRAYARPNAFEDFRISYDEWIAAGSPTPAPPVKKRRLTPGASKLAANSDTA